jgi:hypothetical protein
MFLYVFHWIVFLVIYCYFTATLTRGAYSRFLFLFLHLSLRLRRRWATPHWGTNMLCTIILWGVRYLNHSASAIIWAPYTSSDLLKPVMIFQEVVWYPHLCGSPYFLVTKYSIRILIQIHCLFKWFFLYSSTFVLLLLTRIALNEHHWIAHLLLCQDLNIRTFQAESLLDILFTLHYVV